jgi:hypothetical protein
VGKRLSLLALEFVALTAPLTWLWLDWGRAAYYEFFLRTSRPILLALGVTGVRRDLVHDRFINYLPFLVLILITPGLSPRRRLIGGLLGCGVLYLGHIGLTYASFLAFIKHGESMASTSQLFPAWLLSDALPFVLWAIVAHEVLSRAATHIFQPDSDASPEDD